jgi:putative transcriptional regulator
MEGDLLTIGTQQPSAKVDLSTKMAFSTSKVTYGGPVLADEFSILHSFGEVNGARKLCPGVYIGGSQELISQVRLNRFSPQNALFCKGHAAWVPDQLNKEINKGVWYIAAASPDLLLRYAGAPHSKIDDPHPNDLWTDIMLCMQGEYADIAERFGGGAGDVGRGRLMP